MLRVKASSPAQRSVQASAQKAISYQFSRVVEQILRHLGAWHDPPPRPPPQGLPGPYTYEPCDDVEPTPDYENVLTD